MPRINPTALEETITHAINLQRDLIEQARWVHAWAYLPTGPNDRPTRHKPQNTNPDQIDSHPDDIGLTNDHARRAYLHAAHMIADADRLALRALHLMANGVRPPDQGWAAPINGEALYTIIKRVTRRLGILRHRDVIHAQGDNAADIRKAVHRSADHIIAAHSILLAVQRTRGDIGTIVVRRCANCNDPCEDQTRRECWKCAKYRAEPRNKGKARPIRRTADAIAAKRRRQARGEDYGVEDGGIQAGRVGNDGQWEPARAVTPIFNQAVDTTRHPASPDFRP